MIFVVLLYAISASTFLIGKQLLIYSSPLFITGIRTLLAGLAFFLYARATKHIFSIKQHLFTYLQIALCSFYLSNTLKFWALHSLTNMQAATLSILEPLFALIIAYFLCAEQITLKKWAGLLLCISPALVKSNLFTTNIFTLSSIVLLISIALSSYGAILMRLLIIQENCSPVLVNCISMLIAGVLATSTSLFLETPLQEYSLDTLPSFLFLISIMIIISNIIAYNLYGIVLKRYSVMFIACASFLRPFFTGIYSWLFFNQTFDWYLIPSAAVILTGLIILYQEETASIKMGYQF